MNYSERLSHSDRSVARLTARLINSVTFTRMAAPEDLALYKNTKLTLRNVAGDGHSVIYSLMLGLYNIGQPVLLEDMKEENFTQKEVVHFRRKVIDFLDRFISEVPDWDYDSYFGDLFEGDRDSLLLEKEYIWKEEWELQQYFDDKYPSTLYEIQTPSCLVLIAMMERIRIIVYEMSDEYENGLKHRHKKHYKTIIFDGTVTTDEDYKCIKTTEDQWIEISDEDFASKPTVEISHICRLDLEPYDRDKVLIRQLSHIPIKETTIHWQEFLLIVKNANLDISYIKNQTIIIDGCTELVDAEGKSIPSQDSQDHILNTFSKEVKVNRNEITMDMMGVRLREIIKKKKVSSQTLTLLIRLAHTDPVDGFKRERAWIENEKYVVMEDSILARIWCSIYAYFGAPWNTKLRKHFREISISENTIAAEESYIPKRIPLTELPQHNVVPMAMHYMFLQRDFHSYTYQKSNVIANLLEQEQSLWSFTAEDKIVREWEDLAHKAQHSKSDTARLAVIAEAIDKMLISKDSEGNLQIPASVMPNHQPLKYSKLRYVKPLGGPPYYVAWVDKSRNVEQRINENQALAIFNPSFLRVVDCLRKTSDKSGNGAPDDPEIPGRLRYRIEIKYRQEDFSYCIAYSFANALDYCGFGAACVEMIRYAPLISILPQALQIALIRKVMEVFAPAVGCPTIYNYYTRNKKSKRRVCIEDIVQQVTPYPTVVVLQHSQGRVSHAAAIVDDLLFDSTCENVLYLCKASLVSVVSDPDVSLGPMYKFCNKFNGANVRVRLNKEYTRKPVRHIRNMDYLNAILPEFTIDTVKHQSIDSM